jgi:glycosyltransferase involved in cell wall biosynthesis
MDLSVLIPARNEIFLKQTIDNILENIQGDTEIIAVLDGAWADPQIPGHPRVTLVYHSQSIGQRAATNEAARLSTAKYVMKADAHCAFDKGFDVKLMADCKRDWTVVPRMYNLHAFDWQCKKCLNRTYQGPVPAKCANEKCGNEDPKEFEKLMVWMPRWNRETDFARFDNTLHFQYWGSYKKRPEAQGDIADLMCFVGACFFMERKRYWEIGGLDESHGSWGQMGVEISCKSWLSGGRQVVNKKTWFAHLFRTQPGFGFPYPNPGIEKARAHSRKLWMGNTWDGAIYPLSWLLKKFAPCPDWDVIPEDKLCNSKAIATTPKTEESKKTPESFRESVIEAETETEAKKEDLHFEVASASVPPPLFKPDKVRPPITKLPHELTFGVVYYTDNQCEDRICRAAQDNLLKLTEPLNIPIVSVSLKPIHFGKNIVMDGMQRGILTMFKQILAGLEAVDPAIDVVFMAEHDVLYHPSHFSFVPALNNTYYYNEHTYKINAENGQALFYYTKQTSGLCAYRDLLLDHYRLRVKRVETVPFSRHMGFEPGCHSYPRGVDNYPAERWMSPFPNLDIRHGHNLTPSRWRQEEFRNKDACLGWKMVDAVPGWGVTKNRFWDFLAELNSGNDPKLNRT